MTKEELAYEHAKSVGWNEAVKACAEIAQRWANDAAEFTDSERCKIQHNVCRNIAVAIWNLDRSMQAIDD